jgi:hypothetical protein
MAPGSTQPQTELSTRNPGGEGSHHIRLNDSHIIMSSNLSFLDFVVWIPRQNGQAPENMLLCLKVHFTVLKHHNTAR